MRVCPGSHRLWEVCQGLLLSQLSDGVVTLVAVHCNILIKYNVKRERGYFTQVSVVIERVCYTIGVFIIGVSMVTKRGVLHWGVHGHQERVLHWGVYGHQERGATLGCPWSPREGATLGCLWSSREGCYTGVSMVTKRRVLDWGVHGHQEGCYTGVSMVIKRGVLHWGVHGHQERGATLGCLWSSREGCYTGVSMVTKRRVLDWGVHGHQEGCYTGVSMVTKSGVLHWGVHGHQERGATLGCPWSPREGCYTGVSMVTKRGVLHWGVHCHVLDQYQTNVYSCVPSIVVCASQLSHIVQRMLYALEYFFGTRL